MPKHIASGLKYLAAVKLKDMGKSHQEIANELSLARETVNRNMKKLQEQGIIKRVGADKNGH